MKIILFKGTREEIGIIEAQFYKNNLMYFTLHAPKDIVEKQLKIYKKHYPDVIKKLDSIADTLNVSKYVMYGTFIVSNNQIQKNTQGKDNDKGCSIFGIQNKHGTFVGRNYDWSPNTNNYFKIFKVLLTNSHSYIGITDMDVLPSSRKSLFFEPEDLLNEKGLYIGLTYAYNDNWNFGLTPPHLMTLVSEKCSTVNQALKLIEKTPLSTPKNFFVADRNGHMAVVEHTSKKFKILFPTDNKLIHTNDYVSRDLGQEDTVLKVRPDTDTYIRYYEIVQFLNKYNQKIEYNSIFRFLNSKTTHVFEHNRRFSTIWSLAMNMKKMRYKIGYHHNGKFLSQTLNV